MVCATDRSYRFLLHGKYLSLGLKKSKINRLSSKPRVFNESYSVENKTKTTIANNNE